MREIYNVTYVQTDTFQTLKFKVRPNSDYNLTLLTPVLKLQSDLCLNPD